MDFYEALTGNQQDTSNPVATLGAALSAPPPTVQMPERPAPDTGMMGPLTMLHLAAALAQRRQLGQSRLSQALSSAADAGTYAMDFKAKAEDRAAKRYGEDLSAAQVKSNLTGSAITQQGQQQSNVMAAAKAPYEMASLQEAIKTARNDSELKAIQVRLGKVKEKYAEDMAQAELDMTRAKTQDEKSQAENRYTLAQAAMRTADAHIQSAQAQSDKVKLEGQIFEEGKNKGDFKVIPGLPGEQGNFTYTDRNGNVQTGKMPMDQAEAIKKAKNDWKAMKDLLPDGTDEKNWITQHVRQLTSPPSYQKALDDQQARLKGATPDAARAATPPGAPAPGAPSTAGQVPQQAEIPQEVIQHSKADPTNGKIWTGKDATGAIVKRYLIGGNEVDKATFDRRTAQAAPSSTGQGPASAPAPAAAKASSGAYANERDSLQQEIDAVQASLTTSSSTSDRIAASNKLRILNNALLRLEELAKK